MKNKLLFNFLTPFATSNTQGKTFRNLLALFVMLLGMNGVMGQVSLTSTGSPIIIDFSTAVSGVCSTNVASTTLSAMMASTPAAGQLDADAWAFVKDGTTSGAAASFPGSLTADFTTYTNAGISNTGWGISNISSDRELAILPSGSNATPGSITLLITNNTGVTLNELVISYNVRAYNDQGRSNKVEFWYSATNAASSYTEDTAAEFTSTVTLSSSFESVSRTVTLTSLSIANNSSYYIRWFFDDVAGSGSRDEFHLDDISITGNVSSSPTVIATGTLNTFIASAISSPSSEQTFTVSGSNLTNDIVVTPPTGYQISTSTGGSFSPTNPITLTQSSGTVATTTIYARFNPTALTDQVGGNIAISITGAITQNVAVSGEVTNLSAGAIAFIAFQGATLDLYRIVALNDIPNNTRIWFTDKSWDGGTLSFYSGEGNNVWTNTTGSAIAAGTVIQFNAAGAATLGTGGLNSGLGSSGEQLFAYQGTLTSPTFVAGFTSGTVISTGVPASTETWVPAGLTSGTNFVALGGITFGSSYVTVATHNRSLADMRSHIHNIANLTTGNTSTITNGNWPTYTFNFSNDWIGANGNWNTVGNWSFATVPSSSDHITISSGSPVLDVDYTLPVGKTLTLSGTGGLTINPGKILTIAGTADFGGKTVTIKSDNSGTGIIGQVTGTLSNATNVTVERYIPAKRAWRALTAPVIGSSNNSVFYNWQNNNTSGTSTSTGVDIWGPAGTAGTGSAGNGLAVGPSSSMLTYNSSDNNWSGITDTTDTTNTPLFSSTINNPFMVFVTGPYGTGNITNNSSAATTLRATGSLLIGNQTYSSAATKYTFIGNPYASPLNLKTMLDDTENSDFDNYIWIWQAVGAGNVGVYNTYDPAASTYANATNTIDATTTQIQSGQAFFVKSTAGGTFTIKEIHKGTISSPSAGVVFRDAAPAQLLRVGLYKQINNEWSGRDGAMTVFFADAQANQIPNKMANGSENVAFTKNGTLFASEHHLPLVASDVLNVKVWNTTAGTNYKLKINTEQFNTTNLNATLEDLFTNSRTSIALDGTAVEYPFSVTTEAASTGNRFRIVFENSALGINNPKASGISILPNPITGDGFQVNLGTLSTGTYSYSISNALGQEVEKGNINNVTQNSNYTVKFKNSTANGMYIMKVTGTDNSVFTAKIIKQ
jgi:hypothetical protein